MNLDVNDWSQFEEMRHSSPLLLPVVQTNGKLFLDQMDEANSLGITKNS